MQVISQRRFLLSMIRFTVFFFLFYLYVWLRIDPSLIYHAHGMIPFPVFTPGGEFLEGFLTYPGGIIEYTSAFFSQFFYFSHLGSIIITFAAGLICIAAGMFVSKMGDTRFSAVIYIPAILMLLVYNRYIYCLADCLGLLVILFFLWIYFLTARRKAFIRLAVFIVISIPLYYFTGGIYLLFALLCAIYEFLTKRKILIGLSYILLALFIPYFIGKYIFAVRIIDAYTRLLPLHPESYSSASLAAKSLYIFFPLAAVLVSLSQPFIKVLSPRPTKKTFLKSKAEKTSPGKNVKNYYKKNNLNFLYESIVLFGITAVVVLFSFDMNKKRMLRINYSAYQKNWYQVLEDARHIPYEKYNLLINHDINKALYHTGRLPYDMFSYPQKLKALISLGYLALDKSFSLADLPKLSDTFIQLGLVNNAEQSAMETMELIGEYPAILRQLFFIYIVKGNTMAAKVYLNALSKDLVYGKWAKSILRKLDEDPLMSTNKEIRELRSAMVDTDHVGSFGVEEILQSLMHNKKNRMAFEYLMAYYLLSLQLEKIAQNIHCLEDFNYSNIPRHYEEAIIIHINKTDEKVNLHNMKISQDTVQRFQRFFNIFKRYNWNKQLAINSLARDFGDSYFFYYTFGFSGAKK